MRDYSLFVQEPWQSRVRIVSAWSAMLDTAIPLVDVQLWNRVNHEVFLPVGRPLSSWTPPRAPVLRAVEDWFRERFEELEDA